MTPLVPCRRCQCFDRQMLAVVVRVLLGGWFVYMGAAKALHPVDFLKLVHQYELLQSAPWVNLVAAGLPWFEVFCGVLLVAGVAVRGAALVSAALVLGFTVLVFQRAWTLHAAGGVTFCAIRFDCGCGGGEVAICRKLLENGLLLGAATWVFLVRRGLGKAATDGT